MDDRSSPSATNLLPSIEKVKKRDEMKTDDDEYVKIKVDENEQDRAHMKPRALRRDASSSDSSSKSTPFDIREVQYALRKDNHKVGDKDKANKLLKAKPPAAGMTPVGTNLDPRERVSRL